MGHSHSNTKASAGKPSGSIYSMPRPPSIHRGPAIDGILSGSSNRACVLGLSGAGKFNQVMQSREE